MTSLGFLGAALLHRPSLAVLAQAIIWIGVNSQNGPFWSLPATFLSEDAAAFGIATISSVAFLGGFVGPNVFGRLSDTYHGYTVGLSLLAIMAMTASGLAFRLKHMSVATR